MTCDGTPRCAKLLKSCTALAILNFAHTRQLEFNPTPRARKEYPEDYVDIESRDIVWKIEVPVDSTQVYKVIAQLKTHGFMFRPDHSNDERSKLIGIEQRGMKCFRCSRFRTCGIPLDFDPEFS